MNDAIERSAVFVLLMLSTGAGMAFFMSADATVSSDGQPILQVGYAFFYLAFLMFLVNRVRPVVAVVYGEKWTLLLFLFVLASTLWSVDPQETLRHSLALLGTSIVGVYLGMKYEPRQLLSVVAICVGITAVASLATALFVPSVGVLPDGSWQGVFHLKNSLGRMMALGVILFALIAIDRKRYRFSATAMAVLCGALLVLSRSATGIVVTILLLAALSMRRVVRWSAGRLTVAGATVGLPLLVAGVWVLQNPDAVLAILGRNTTLTGRLGLWHAVKQEIETRPLFGHGFSAFWTSSAADRLNEVISWDAPNAHNAFLEALLGLGMCGLALLVMSLLQNLRLGWKAARSQEDMTHTWPLFFLAFMVLYSLTESSMLQPNSMLWMIYIANSCWLVRAQRSAYRVSSEVPEGSATASSAALQPGVVSP